MKHYIQFDASGAFVGRYIEGLNSVIPDSAIEISAELFNRTTYEQKDGEWRLVNGEVVKVPFPEPPPIYITLFSVLDFRDRFTMAEQIAIRQSQLSDMEVGLVYDAFISAQFIDVEDPRVAAGIDLYIDKGLLEPDRKTELLAPQAA